MPTDEERARLLLDEAALRVWLSWEGGVGREFGKRLEFVERMAKITAGRRTGELIAKIQIKREPDTLRALEGHVGVNPNVGEPDGYSTFTHEGTRPHIIRPKNPGGKLAFRVHGRMVYTNMVRHPGNRPNPYLSRWIEEAIL